ncbi:phosphate signaling complex protein PhoU [Oryzobacter telluris]|uniref:phosphate signaling complex protein PhoU n=1 Tax=Oryzobacter telluris TaxID=3149179 RepID=UPI00370D1813
MRKAFHEELDRVAETLVEMTHLAASAMNRATTALLDADIHLADSVIAADAEIDARRAELDLMSFDLLARQQPVATDLRVIVTSMRMSSDIERMGDLARHVAKVARLRYPESAVPAELRATILQMGQVAERIVEKAGSVIAARDVVAAQEIERDDDAMDDLHRELFSHVTDGTWTHGTEAAVDITLLGRYYERFADHAVSVAHRVIWLVTGEFDPRSEDSHEDVEDDAPVLHRR